MGSIEVAGPDIPPATASEPGVERAGTVIRPYKLALR
jgi:hypothetical protein